MRRFNFKPVKTFWKLFTERSLSKRAVMSPLNVEFMQMKVIIKTWKDLREGTTKKLKTASCHITNLG